MGDPGEGPLIVPVQLGGQTGFAGQTTARGGMAAAIHTQSDGASSIPAASGGLLVPFGGKRLAIWTAPAVGRRRGPAALDAERAVGLPAAAVDPGAVGPPARGEAVVAARIAFGRRPVPALYAEAGLLPFFLALLQAPAAEREMFFVAGLAEPPAGLFGGGAAFLAEAPVASQQAAFAGRLPIAGAAALLAFRAVFRPVGRLNAAAVQTESERGKPVPGARGVGPPGGRRLRGSAGAAATAARLFGRQMRRTGGGSRHGRRLLLAERAREPVGRAPRGHRPDNPFPTFRPDRQAPPFAGNGRRRRLAGRACRRGSRRSLIGGKSGGRKSSR